MPPKKKEAKPAAKKGAEKEKTSKKGKEEEAAPPAKADPPASKPDEVHANPQTSSSGKYGPAVDEYTGRFLTHYDNTAGVPLPRTAVEQHIAMKHSVVDLLTAFKERYERLQHSLRTKLVPNKLRLETMKDKLMKCTVNAVTARERIEKVTKQDCDAILNRLRQAEARRQTAIQNEINRVNGELEEIDHIFRDVQMSHISADYHNSLTPGAPSAAFLTNHTDVFSGITPPNPSLMLHLIQQYPDLQMKIDQLASRIPIIDTDFNASDFPTETSDRLAVISRCDKYAKAIAVKDEMLWLALCEKEKLDEKLVKETRINAEYFAEIQKWADVVQQHVAVVQKTKRENELLQSENLKLKTLLRKHNIHFVDVDSNVSSAYANHN